MQSDGGLRLIGTGLFPGHNSSVVTGSNHANAKYFTINIVFSTFTYA